MTGHQHPDTLTPDDATEWVIVRIDSRSHRGGAATEHAVRDWRHDGLCRASDHPDLWFPDGKTGHWFLQAEEAKAICRRCPALEACWQWAMETRPEHGIFGGLDEDERRNLKRRAARNPATKAKTA